MTVETAVVAYLDEANLMQVVTSQSGQPWAATVFFATDNRHYLYWLSPASTRHSHNIEHNNRVCGAITTAHRYGQPPQGLQFEGVAREVPAEELETNFQAFAERYNAHHRLEGLLNGEDNDRLYQIIPSLFVLYDEEHFPTQPRQEWRLDSGGIDSPALDDQTPGANSATSSTTPYNPFNG